MRACSTKSAWRLRRSGESGVIRWRRTRLMRCFISAAAESVNVTTSSRLISQGGLASQTRWTQRSASTAVFPDPAAALTSRLRPTVENAARWLGVQGREDVPVDSAIGDPLEHFFAIDGGEMVEGTSRFVEAAEVLKLTVRARRYLANPIRLDGDSSA